MSLEFFLSFIFESVFSYLRCTIKIFVFQCGTSSCLDSSSYFRRSLVDFPVCFRRSSSSIQTHFSLFQPFLISDALKTSTPVTFLPQRLEERSSRRASTLSRLNIGPEPPPLQIPAVLLRTSSCVPLQLRLCCVKRRETGATSAARRPVGADQPPSCFSCV